MTYFRKVFRFAIPYKKFIFLNIFFNILYAFFSALSFLSLMPMLEVLFGDDKQKFSKPEFDSLSNFGNNLEEWLNYQVYLFSGDDPKKALIFVTVLPETQENAAIDFLKRQRSEFKSFIKKKSRMNRIPQFDFLIDEGEKSRQRIDEISNEIKEEE